MNYCIANWKMNLTISESMVFLEEFQKKNLQKTKNNLKKRRINHRDKLFILNIPRGWW